jgi:two-component system nitrogen regulation sensor histidine kinase NtrY
MVLAWLIFNTSLYATMIVTGLVIAYQVYTLIAFVEKSNRAVTSFLESIKSADFSDQFTSGLKGRSFDELNAAFADVIKRFRDLRQDREEHFRYLHTVVQHIGIGLIAFDEKGEVQLINNAARRLFHTATLKNIDRLAAFSADLVARLREAQSGRQQLVTVRNTNDVLQLSLYTTRLHLRQRHITLASFQNISNELNAREMDAWQNLIRVLTHEIRNSLTPISSLAATVEEMLNQPTPSMVQPSGDSDTDIREALGTIRGRCDGLLNFVDSYRRLTRLPKPTFQPFRVSDLLHNTVQLVMPDIASRHILLQCSIEPESLELIADRQLVEQVLLNLLGNAVDALADQPNAAITMMAFGTADGRVAISVTDNGPGIVPDALEQIFVPFYTTKKGGSGIGLSLSRQIMRLHRGTLTVRSAPDAQTTFTLLF